MITDKFYRPRINAIQFKTEYKLYFSNSAPETVNCYPSELADKALIAKIEGKRVIRIEPHKNVIGTRCTS